MWLQKSRRIVPGDIDLTFVENEKTKPQYVVLLPEVIGQRKH